MKKSTTKKAPEAPKLSTASVDLSALSPAELEAYNAAVAAPLGRGFWKPETPGEMLCGVLQSVTIEEGIPNDNGEPTTQKVATFSTPQGSRCVSLQTVLASQFDSLGVREGERVMIVFRGLGQKKKGRNASKLFQVRIVGEPERIPAPPTKGVRTEPKATARRKGGKP
jgi:hypothetical protein